jgi:hypothetical protein
MPCCIARRCRNVKDQDGALTLGQESISRQYMSNTLSAELDDIGACFGRPGEGKELRPR